jgi:omega-hydroxy-beta-dihydromenaquinone-9 sulfotransferase
LLKKDFALYHPTVTKMLYLNYRSFFSGLFTGFLTGLFGAKKNEADLNPHRFRVLLLLGILYPLMKLFQVFTFFLDDIFFPGYRRQQVEKPIFLIGNFRSGTTLLQRLLARDQANFSGMKTWEIYLAPSISARKLLRGILILDKLIGGPIRNAIARYNTESLDTIKMHKVGLYEPEEDVGLLLYIWSGLFTIFFFPEQRIDCPYVYYDRDLSERVRLRQMKFYKKCVQKHLYMQGRPVFYISKNPSFSPMTGSLKMVFPDARFIYLLRDPREVLASEIGWFSFCWNYFNSTGHKYPYNDFVLDMAYAWYTYSLELLEQLPKEDYRIVRFHRLTSDLHGEVESIYRHFDLHMSQSFRNLLKHETDLARRYSNPDRKRLDQLLHEELGRGEDDILRRFAGINESI